ncbi:MAG: ABC transporter substrate-binding protein [Pseudohongiellaceae bacterium]
MSAVTIRQAGLAGILLSFFMIIGIRPAVAADATQEAVDAAQSAVTSLLSRVEELRPYYDSDEARYFEGIEEEVAGFVDFEQVAIGVMARFSRQASDEQILAFAEKLRSTLTRFYGSALVEYGGQEITYLPPDEPPEDPERGVNVGLRIQGGDQQLELQSAMFRNDSGEWKLRNLYVGGINLRRQYHTQFAALMSRHDNDIDTVIENWQ